MCAGEPHELRYSTKAKEYVSRFNRPTDILLLVFLHFILQPLSLGIYRDVEKLQYKLPTLYYHLFCLPIIVESIKFLANEAKFCIKDPPNI